MTAKEGERDANGVGNLQIELQSHKRDNGRVGAAPQDTRKRAAWP